MNKPVTLATKIRIAKDSLRYYKEIYDSALRGGRSIHDCREEASATWKKTIKEAECAKSYTLGLDEKIRQRVLKVCVKRLGWIPVDNTARPPAHA